MSAANKGYGSTEWDFIFKEDVDIDNFHIKCATIYKDYLIIFARGKPRDVVEQCCSFFLTFKLKTQGNLVTGYETPYNYWKLDPCMYAEQFGKIFANIDASTGTKMIFRVDQENSYNANFPRQVLEMSINLNMLGKDDNLIKPEERRDLKIIDV